VDEISDTKQQFDPDRVFRTYDALASASLRTSPRAARYKQNRLNLANKPDAIVLADVEQQIKSFFR